ncbi:type II toxin-antitoxin system VapC family toxin [Phyllobacterium sp. 628]|uniref:type II toxin-antitoxin system VapC family toxin n=1 Tax=Phyllobacterium sp. 628 TaxID=2718938 RepID=UPI0016626D16|nr:type II toxin-antitoxin system VapC family toxin [Phyllobacterium sp. 628]QND51490.1 type II toxin-antitoxin system VapC family toxin [Phyllobacterium sp. 628]
MTLVDTNILLDIVANDSRWADWSIARLEEAFLDGPLLINDIVYAELSVRYERIEDLDQFIEQAQIALVPMSRSALFLAGKAFSQYRQSGGSRTNVLPDFFIGAHALVENMPLLTRDAARYRTYFKSLNLIVPDEDISK